MKIAKWTALAVLTLIILIMGRVLFAEEAVSPISADDQVAILRCQKQQSDIQAQYNKLYADFLQSPQVSALTAQNLQVNANLSMPSSRRSTTPRLTRRNSRSIPRR